MEAPPPCTSPRTTTIAGHPVTLREFDFDGRRAALYVVDDLESRVDRAALLRGDDEPPYWAYLWSGARVLAAYVARYADVTQRRVLEIGCGLALPGMTAAVGGAEVTLVDAAPEALAVASASAAVNDVRCATICADFNELDPAMRFDVVLAAEVAYDREGWSDLAAVCARHLSPGGVTLLADGYRTDTRGLYAALAARDLVVHAIDVRVIEEGRAMPLRLAAVTPRGDSPPRPA